jgi:hypothetical protein
MAGCHENFITVMNNSWHRNLSWALGRRWGMRPKPLALTLLIAALAAPAAAAQATPDDVPLVRMRDGHGSDLLFRVDPRTLKPEGRPIRTFRGGADLAFAQDGGRIAYTDAVNRRSRIHFVDVAGWRSLGVARLGNRGQLGVGWVSPRRVVAYDLYGAGRRPLMWVDARSRKVVARRTISGMAWGGLAVPGGYALALAPERGVGPLRILLAAPDGGVRTITLERIRAGADYGERRGAVLTPALTADPEGGRLYAVAARGLVVAEVELASGAVSYHSLGASASKGNVDVWFRDATWAGDGRIAVTGMHWPPTRGRRPDGPVPFGARIIDTRSWTITTLDARPDTIDVAEGTVLATGTRWFDGGRRSESSGLLAFDQSGRRAFARFRGRQIVLCGSRGPRAYVWLRRDRRLHVIDVRTGRTLREIRTGKRVPFLLSPPG